MTDEATTPPPKRKPRRPKGLGPEAGDLWRDVTTTYEMRADELQLLRDACREIDLIERLEAAQREAPLTVLGSQGQQVASPHVSELRQHRNTLRGLLAAIRLPDPPGAEGAHRPGTFNSERASAAAAIRWGRPAA